MSPDREVTEDPGHERRARSVMSLKTSSWPAWPARLRPDRFTLLTIAIAGLGAAFVLGHVTFGVMTSTDSAEYIYTARSLLAGEGLLGIGGSPYPFWPPLYPLLLAAAGLGIFDPFDVAGPLNVVIFGLTVFAVGQYLRQRLASRFLAAWGCLATALAVPLSYWSSWAHSEPLFILLTTLALIQTDRYLAKGSLRALIWAAVFSALAWQTRYIGVVVPAFVGLILLFQPGRSPAQRAGRITAYSLIAAAPMGLWLVLHNFLTTGDFIQHPPPRDYPVSTMLRDVFDILWSWTQTHAAAWLAPLVCMFVAVERRRLKVADWRPFWLFGVFALMYLVLFIAAISLLVGIYLERGNPQAGISDRLLVPLYIPLLIAGVWALDRVLDHEREKRWLGSVGSLPILRTMAPGKKGSVLANIVMIVLSLGVAGQAVLNVSTIVKKSHGELARFFNGPRWTGSETLRYARENLAASRVSRVYNNAPQPLALHIVGKEPTLHHRGLCNRLESLEQEMKRMPDGAYVVWFDGWKRHLFDYGEDDLRLLPGMELVAELDDGVVFKVAGPRLSPKHPSPVVRSTRPPTCGDDRAGLNFDRYHCCPR